MSADRGSDYGPQDKYESGSATNESPPFRRLDEFTGQVLDRVGEGLPRRGFLSKAGRLALTALGAGIVIEQVAAPIVMPSARANHPAVCGDWDMCQMDGRLCGCTGCSPDVYTGPDCGRVGGWWMGCCRKPGVGCKVVHYVDWYQQGCSEWRQDNCRACHWCLNNGGIHPPYDGTAPYYLCTEIRHKPTLNCNTC